MHKKIIEISKGLKSNFFFDYDIYKSTWFQAGGRCDFFCIVENIDELKKIIKNIENIPYFIIGAGSNLLIRDGGYKGLIIKLGNYFNKMHLKDNEIIAGAGILDVNLSKFAYINSIKNFEFYSGIPGNLGGAVKMNAGCFGNETKNILNSITVVDRYGEEKLITNKLLDFSYRSSNLKDEIIVNSSFKAEIDNQKEIKNVFHPALNTHPDHKIWKRDFKGASGIFGIEFKKNISEEAAEYFADQCLLFGKGASWGGYESLMTMTDLYTNRTLKNSFLPEGPYFNAGSCAGRAFFSFF